MFFKKISTFLLFGFLASFITITKGMEKPNITAPKNEQIKKEIARLVETYEAHADNYKDIVFEIGQNTAWSSKRGSKEFLAGLLFMLKSGLLIILNSYENLPEENKKNAREKAKGFIDYAGCVFFHDSHYVVVPDKETWDKLKEELLKINLSEFSYSEVK